MNKYIGINHINSTMFGGIDSSFNNIFKDEEILVEAGMDYIPCQVGDISEIYDILKKNLDEKMPSNFHDLANLIFEAVQTYFGNYSNINDRMNNYHDLDEIEYLNLEVGKVSDLKGKNAAMCVERAIVTQNILKTLGYNSYYKASGIVKDGKIEGHAYNLVENNGEYYIFDTAIPTIENGKISPIVASIPKEVFDKMKSPSSSIGYSVMVSHFNPLRNTDVSITYDEGREELIDLTRETKIK